MLEIKFFLFYGGGVDGGVVVGVGGNSSVGGAVEEIPSVPLCSSEVIIHGLLV